ncbi:response regulator [Streptomyces bluensis]|uniref:Response regulator transcription factor n=1 Tax=Streptomyces bluensis TaxID=33897 RepID=A0ABW6UNM0_9ACTN
MSELRGNENVRVFLVDEHHMFRAGVRHELQNSPDLELVGEAATGEQAIRHLQENPQSLPHVILADLSPSGISEADFIRATEDVAIDRRIHILFSSAAETDDGVIAAMSAGAHGFLGRSGRGDGRSTS